MNLSPWNLLLILHIGIITDSWIEIVEMLRKNLMIIKNIIKWGYSLIPLLFNLFTYVHKNRCIEWSDQRMQNENTTCKNFFFTLKTGTYRLCMVVWTGNWELREEKIRIKVKPLKRGFFDVCWIENMNEYTWEPLWLHYEPKNRLIFIFVLFLGLELSILRH